MCVIFKKFNYMKSLMYLKSASPRVSFIAPLKVADKGLLASMSKFMSL